DVKRDVYQEAGVRPPFALEAFDDPAEDVRQSIARIEGSPFVPYKQQIRGFVFDVKTGQLLEVGAKEKAAAV
ncbi:MAG: carbonic anhydrase, partial [Acidimicrobiia bacterium]